MLELLQSLLVLLGFVASHVADAEVSCAGGACPDVRTRPVVTWTAQETLDAREVRLFSRGERRPGQPADGGDVALRIAVPDATVPVERAWTVPPAGERVVLRLRATGGPRVR